MTAILWLVILVVLLFMEAQTVTLVSLWFAAGALAALIAALLDAVWWVQVILFVAVSCISLACLRPVVRKYLRPRLVKTNVDALVGTCGYVLTDVDNLAACGTVKLGAMEWTARSTSGEPIAAGTLVKVDKIEGVKAFVSVAEVQSTVG